MVNIDIHEGGRCDFLAGLRNMNAKTGVEVGVLNGDNAEVVCRSIPTVETLYCVDPYQTDVENYDDTSNNSQRVQDCRADLVQALIDTGNIRGHLVRATSKDAASILAKYAPFDFVYIDANHAIEHVREDIALWAPLVRSGGIIAGHDFCFEYLDSVVPAVFEYAEKNSMSIHLYRHDGIWCFVK